MGRGARETLRELDAVWVRRPSHYRRDDDGVMRHLDDGPIAPGSTFDHDRCEPATGDDLTREMYGIWDRCYVIPYTIGGDYSGSDLTASNRRRLLEDFPTLLAEGYGMYSSAGAYLPAHMLRPGLGVGEDLQRLAEAINGLESYPAYDDEDMSVWVQEQADDAWDQWVRYDLPDAIEAAHDEATRDRWDGLDNETQQRLWWDAYREACEAGAQGFYCEGGGETVTVDLDDIAPYVEVPDA